MKRLLDILRFYDIIVEAMFHYWESILEIVVLSENGPA